MARTKAKTAAVGQTMEVVVIPAVAEIPKPPKDKKTDGVSDEAWKLNAMVLNDKIKADLASGESAQLSLCRGFGSMNDGVKPSLRLYKALGFKTFDWYCESLNVALSTGHMYVTIGKLLALLPYNDNDLLTIGISSLREIARLVKKDNKYAERIAFLCNGRIDGSLTLAAVAQAVTFTLGASAGKSGGTQVDMTGDDNADETPTAPVEPWRADIQSLLDSATSFADFGKAFRAFAKTYKTPADEAMAA